jgi:filamentous hemagglutinin family protein
MSEDYWRAGFWKLAIALTFSSVSVPCWESIVSAQIIPDETLAAESSVVTPDNIRGIESGLAEGEALRVRISGGAIRGSNLFHSFREFNIGEGKGGYFENPAAIENIFSRVTGSNPSNILGTLGVLGNANLFFLNPNGILFGPNASLDLRGSFLATTADIAVIGLLRYSSSSA